MIPMHVALKEIRESAGFEKQEVAEAVGCSASFIGQLEGAHAKASTQNLKRLALTYGLSPGFFVYLEDPDLGLVLPEDSLDQEVLQCLHHLQHARSALHQTLMERNPDAEK